MFPSDGESEGKIHGATVLQAYKYPWSGVKLGEWIGIMFAIIVAYRLLGYAALALKKNWRVVESTEVFLHRTTEKFMLPSELALSLLRD